VFGNIENIVSGYKKDDVSK